MRTPPLLYAGLAALLVFLAFAAFGLVAGSGR